MDSVVRKGLWEGPTFEQRHLNDEPSSSQKMSHLNIWGKCASERRNCKCKESNEYENKEYMQRLFFLINSNCFSHDIADSLEEI